MKKSQLMQYQNELFEALYSDKGIQHIVDIASAILKNPVVVSDISNKVLAKTPGYDLYGISLLEDDKTAFLNNDLIQTSQKVHLPEQLRQSGLQPLITEIPEKGQRYCLCLIRVRSSVIAHFAVCQNKTVITEDIFPLVEMLAKIFALELQKGNNPILAGFASSRLFLLDLLEKRILSPRSIQSRLDDLGWHPKDEFRLFIIPSIGSTASNLMLQYTLNYLQLIIPNSLYALNEMGIVLLTTTERNAELSSVDMQALSDYLIDSDLMCGVSNSFYELRDVSDAYLQTLAVLEVSRRMNTTNRIVSFEDYHPFLLIDYYSEKFSLKSLCMPTMLLLQEYDRNHKTPLLPTLKYFIETGMDYTKTAGALFIHRNSLGYRIDKIKSILNISDFSGPVLQQIQFTLQIFEYMEARGIGAF